ncbi:MAG: hypothetical protein KGI29_04430 [Pseudomonadota bacterium]|nr:hypothetical protein [Pseudomonadota bacterium]MDE3036844.1 hypothetical protein [Pseudomonadota bacterium]
MTNSPKDWVDILAALSTPTLALFGIYIAWRQWRTAELKRKQDLFDKRYAVYEKVLDFLAAIKADGNAKPQTRHLLYIPRRQAFFLFGSDVKNYTDELFNHSAEFEDKNEWPPNERTRKVQKERELLNYFETQYAKSEALFCKYIRVDGSIVMKKINWLHGLSRLWIVASVLWVIGMGWYQHNVWNHSAVSFLASYNPDCEKYAGNIANTAQNVQPVKTVEISKSDADFWNSLPDAPSAYKDKAACIADHTAAHNEYITEVWCRIAWVILPPLLVPLIFAIGLWIKHGFKAEAK